MKTGIITEEAREKLRDLLPANYRHIVAERAQCHPNTVYNVLEKGTDNPRVVLELMVLAKENKDAVESEKQMRRKAERIMKQL